MISNCQTIGAMIGDTNKCVGGPCGPAHQQCGDPFQNAPEFHVMDATCGEFLVRPVCGAERLRHSYSQLKTTPMGHFTTLYMVFTTSFTKITSQLPQVMAQTGVTLCPRTLYTGQGEPTFSRSASLRVPDCQLPSGTIRFPFSGCVCVTNAAPALRSGSHFYG